MLMIIGHVVVLMSKHVYQIQQLNMVRKYLDIPVIASNTARLVPEYYTGRLC